MKGRIEGQGGISLVYDPHYCYYTLYGRIEGQGGIGNVYDPHYRYYTLYGCRDILRVREVLVMCTTFTTVIIHRKCVGMY